MLTGLIVVVVLAVAGLAIHRRGFAGYALAPAGLAVLHRGEAAFVDAVAEVLFPGGSREKLDGIDLHSFRSTSISIWRPFPRAQRIQIRLLFLAVEHLTLFLPGDEPGGRRRFSSLSPPPLESRSSSVWAPIGQGVLRLFVTALRSVFVLAFLGHPANLQGLGLLPFEIEAAVGDAELLFPRIGGLPRLGRVGRGGDRTDADPQPSLDTNGPRHRAYARAASRGAGFLG